MRCTSLGEVIGGGPYSHRTGGGSHLGSRVSYRGLGGVLGGDVQPSDGSDSLDWKDTSPQREGRNDGR